MAGQRKSEKSELLSLEEQLANQERKRSFQHGPSHSCDLNDDQKDRCFARFLLPPRKDIYWYKSNEKSLALVLEFEFLDLQESKHQSQL